MHIAAKLAAAGIFATLAGCSSLSPGSLMPSLSSLNPFADKPRNPPAELTEFKQGMPLRTVWSGSIGGSGLAVLTPALAGSSVYVAAADGSLARLDAATGRQQWRVNAGLRLSAGVGAAEDGGTVVVAGEKGVLLAFDGEGKQRWKAQASSEILSAPAVGQGLVVVRSQDNRIAAYDMETGARRWFTQRTTPPLTLRGTPGITISGQSAFVAMPGGKLLSLALGNGAVAWEISVSEPRGATELERVADLSGIPQVSGREVCAVGFQGKVGCFDLGTGAPRWRKDLSSSVGLGLDERFVFAADERGALSAFSRDAGRSVWRNDILKNRRLSTPVSFGRAVGVGDGQGFIHFLSREDGALLARTATDGSPILAAPQVAGQNVIFQTTSGTVLALAAD